MHPEIHSETDLRSSALTDLIDRVVDGGLTAQELRDAVARLDASEAGWKRCALAFIEAQSLGEILREIGEEHSSEPRVVPFRSRMVTVRRLAMAASVIVLAFGLGWMGHQGWNRLDAGQNPLSSGIASSSRSLGAGLPTPPQPATEGLHENSPPSSGLAATFSHEYAGEGLEPKLHSQSLAPVVRGEGPRSGGEGSFIMDQRLRGGVHSTPYEESPGYAEISGESVPIALGPDLAPLQQWMDEQPPVISEYERAALEREGYRVDERREVVIGALDDGRLAAVPVENVQVKYVGHQPL